MDQVKEGGAKKKGLGMLAKLKSAAKSVIQTQRFQWNSDLLHAHSQADEKDFMSLSKALKEKEEAEEKDQMTPEQYAARCDKLKASITSVLYNYVRRGLFERDKLTVAALITFGVLEDQGSLNSDVLRVLINDRADEDPPSMPEEIAVWMPEAQWRKIKCIEDDLGEPIPAFQDLGEKFGSDSEEWLSYYNYEAPETLDLPGNSEMKGLGPVEKILILRALRPDRVTFALKSYIGSSLGEEFVNQAPFDMKGTYMEASASTPIFFVLFPGVDPTGWVEALGASFDIQREKFVNISMGQGQEKLAEDTLQRMSEGGGWVMLQNVHLMQSWLPVFERKLELCSESAHSSFRCFISAEPPSLSYMKNIPEALLQSCIKVSNEAPADLKSNMRRSWTNFSQERIEQSSQPEKFQGCLFTLSFFHSVMLGRKKFGQQGWSRNYGFNTGDLTICANVLQSYLDKVPEAMGVPWQDLRYIFGDIMYGGHITDPWDRRTNNTYLEVMFTEGCLNGEEMVPCRKGQKDAEGNILPG